MCSPNCLRREMGPASRGVPAYVWAECRDVCVRHDWGQAGWLSSAEEGWAHVVLQGREEPAEVVGGRESERTGRWDEALWSTSALLFRPGSHRNRLGLGSGGGGFISQLVVAVQNLGPTKSYWLRICIVTTPWGIPVPWEFWEGLTEPLSFTF